MYLARGRPQRLRFFTTTIRERSNAPLLLGNSMRRALERNQLSLVYQPQMALDSDRLIGVEALLRWNHPELGPISPAEFISRGERATA